MGLQNGKKASHCEIVAMVLACAFLTIGALQNASAAGYMNAEALGERLNQIAKSAPQILRVRTLAQSLKGRNIWLVELGSGGDEERRKRPAMLVVAGIEGNDLAGCAAAVSWIEQLADQNGRNDQVSALLRTTTLYVVPRLNSDGAEHFFEKPAVESSVSDKPVDDDHDGMVDEDGPEDMNGDGRITMMRIRDPEGEYILDPAEPRLLMKADRTKGEVGAWKLLTEGRDNDGDEKWNEDGRGGVNFNRNFPFAYKWFAPDSGVHQVSETETRALADFVIAHPNIGVVFTFGAADNLLETPKSGPRPGRGKPATVINDGDLPYYRELGKIYRKTLGLKKELKGASQPGSFSDWIYFDRGRLSLAACPWSPAMQLAFEEAKSKKKEKTKNNTVSADKPTSPVGTAASATNAVNKEQRAGEDEEDKRNKDEREFLKWLDENAPGLFLPWKVFKHPDFPGERVEIGGFAAFAKTSPPPEILADLTTRQADFLTTLALRLPRVRIRRIESKPLGNSVYEIKIQVENTGYLPTALKHGEITREVFPTRVTLDLDNDRFLSGTKMTRLSAIDGSGGMKEVRCIVYVPKRKQIRVRVVSMIGGTVEGIVKLDGVKRP